ncbi:hypothetical protein BC629DRAFT_1598940 [Irpex lacteus]|nr:hypothetical protein BC629DRAFT_1598940 [Irpex lacteus]
MSTNLSTATTATPDASKTERQATPSGDGQGYLTRLQRTATTVTSHGLNYFNKARGGTDGNATPKSPNVDGSGTNPATPKEDDGVVKPTAFERFMSLGKARKDWEVEWPPSHWNGEEDGKKDVVETIHPVEPNIAPSHTEQSQEPHVLPSGSEKTPDPASLAERIQRLLNSSPPQFPPPEPLSRPPETSTEIPAPEAKAIDQTTGEPSPRPPLEPPPRHPALTSDPKLVSLLSSPAVMNGDSKAKDKDGGAGQSVWDALERLKAQIPWANKTQPTSSTDTQKPADKGKGKDTSTSAASETLANEMVHEEDVLDDDESGVMVYGPLFPSTDPIAAASDVELAKSELVPVSEHSHHGQNHAANSDKPSSSPQPESTTTPKSSTFGSHQDKIDLLKTKVEEMWPFAKNTGAQQAESEEGGEPVVSTTRVHFQPVTENAKKRRVWVPSEDKISVQVMWWGYRIYLPPPVLAALDTSTLTAAKRAALLTTALKYALDRVPMAIVPLPAQPAMRLCKAFVPYLGYVGGFVAWSWGAVKGFDKGHGVTLSATWLLSVAVVPGTWEPPKGVKADEETKKVGEKEGEKDRGEKGVNVKVEDKA